MIEPDRDWHVLDTFTGAPALNCRKRRGSSGLRGVAGTRPASATTISSGLIDPLKALQLADPRTATTVPPSLAPPMRIIRQR
jgi:hypothetical protein